MKRAMSNYPVGATWEATSEEGKSRRIWLEKRSENLEMWMWATFSSDGSVNKQDWNPSYNLCREEIPIWNTKSSCKRLVFKRVK